MRTNGWEKPIHYLQMITWIFFPTLMILFFICYTPFLSTITAITTGVVYGILCIMVVYSVYRCTATNPADDSIYTTNAITDTNVSDDQVYCNVCLHYVHKESRHCRLCDKCVQVFDHHCKWLNNCVGKKNYHFFLSSVVSTTTLLSIQAVLGIYLVYTMFHNPTVIRQRSASVFGCLTGSADPTTNLCQDNNDTISLHVIRIIHAILLAVVIPWWFLLAQLTLFHFQLCYEKITTYDYIVRKRKRKQQRERENAVRQPLRLRILSIFQCQRERLVYEPPVTPGKSCSSHESETKDETIEVQVDDDLEILSVTSDEGRRSFRRKETRGFGKYVDMGQHSDPAHTPQSLDSQAPFLVVPVTPQSPRSDPSSAYHSEVSEPDERKRKERDILQVV